MFELENAKGNTTVIGRIRKRHIRHVKPSRTKYVISPRKISEIIF